MADDSTAPAERDGDEPPGHLRDEPYTFLAAAGTKYAYCRCQRSRRFPLCDGSHRSIGDGTVVTPIKVTPEVSKPFTWCACGRSAAKPDCDGSHRH